MEKAVRVVRCVCMYNTWANPLVFKLERHAINRTSNFSRVPCRRSYDDSLLQGATKAASSLQCAEVA